MKRFMLLICAAFLLCSCSVFVSDPQVTLKDVNVVGVDTGGVEIEFYLSVKNNNPFDLKLMGYNYDLRVMALPTASGGSRETLEFKAGKSADMRIPVRLSLSSLLEILKRRPDPNAIPYNIVAGLELDTPVGAVTVPVDHSGAFAVPQNYRPAYFLKQISDVFKGR